jgi:hypothetical protein
VDLKVAALATFTQEIAGSNPAGGTGWLPLMTGVWGVEVAPPDAALGADGSVSEAIVSAIVSTIGFG